MRKFISKAADKGRIKAVQEDRLSKIGTRGSQTKPDLMNTAGDWAIRSHILELWPWQRQRCGHVHCRDEAAHRYSL